MDQQFQQLQFQRQQLLHLRGDVLMVLEAMKMENEIVAPQDGTVASVNVQVGSQVEAGDTLVTLN